MLHKAMGLSATVTAGREDNSDAGGVGYVKLDHEADLVAVGPPAVSVDLHHSADLSTEGSSGRAYGAALVQTVELIGAEVYAAVRIHQYDDNVANYQDGTAVMIGARFRF